MPCSRQRHPGPILNLFAKLLGRDRPRITKVAPQRTDTGAHVTATIDRALNAAGLTQYPGTGVDIRATIDRALAHAGLAQPSPIVDGAIATPTSGGRWLSRTFSNDAGTRSYMLYVPVDRADSAAAPMPLIVMLH